MVIWITGLSGAGKSTLGRSLYNDLKKRFPNTLWFDGETTNRLTDKTRKYDRQSRINQYKKHIRLYEFCHNQKINLIISCLYFDKPTQINNKKVFKKYFEIYLKSDIKQLIKRDSKGTYRKNLRKKKPNIVGHDIKLIMPKGSDVVIENFFKKDISFYKKKILSKIKNKFNKF